MYLRKSLIWFGFLIVSMVGSLSYAAFPHDPIHEHVDKISDEDLNKMWLEMTGYTMDVFLKSLQEHSEKLSECDIKAIENEFKIFDILGLMDSHLDENERWAIKKPKDLFSQTNRCLPKVCPNISSDFPLTSSRCRKTVGTFW